MLRKILLVLALFSGGLTLAQDVHWSQFYDNPVFLNPANAGNFRGTSRFHLQYRDQWRSVTKPFQTFSFSYDTRFTKKPQFGLGLLVLNDVSGDGKFKTLEVQLAPSYEKILNRDSSDVLSFGGQLAINHRNFTFPNFYFDEQFDGVSYDPALPVTEDLFTEKRTNLSLGLGAKYRHRFDRKKSFETGLSAFNINQPNQGFYGVKVKRDLRLCFFVNADLKLKEKLSLLPGVLLQKQGTYTELIFGARVKYVMKNEEKNYKAVYGGVFFRSRDAFFLNLGMDYNKWYFGLSYDVNVSSLTPASGRRGGLELVTRYVINRFKPKQIQHRICPEFI
ncbi:MAG: PorP/SprF family type IX secretion system membrane protein [Bacteroidota bacterium]